MLISSYLSKKDNYLPFFEFPIVTALNKKDNDDIDENFISQARASEFKTFTINAISRIGGCENLILAGLSKEQKSFLDFLSNFNVIEISSVEEVDFCLFPFITSDKKQIKCKPEDCLAGLFSAINSNSILKFDDYAETISNQHNSDEGILIIENDNTVSSVIAINYAYSINASIEIVSGVDEGEENVIRNLIRSWQEKDSTAYDKILSQINSRIGRIDFTKFKFATFFTTGLPYSLGINNVLPCTYVHLFYRVDFFIINNLIFEKSSKIGSAIVFSPQNFSDEETSEVINILESNNYFVEKLIGQNASVGNIDKCLQYYPYDLFHICSHGGEIDGYEIIEEFIDRDGNKHIIEYDEVVGFAASFKTGYVNVQRKTIPRKFDGFVWKSKELKAQNYPRHVFVDMQTGMSENFKNINQIRKPKSIIPSSCAIKCSFSNYQALFSVLANHTSPLIFNNTCWSANAIAECFLVSGVRGYICTLWAVENSVANKVAQVFYKNLFSSNILNAFFRAIDYAKGSTSENIYIYYGLHFSTLQPARSLYESKIEVFKSLMREYISYQKLLKERKGKRNEDLIIEIIKWLQREISFHSANR